MGKPGTKEVTVRLPLALYAQVAAAAEERDVSVNWLLNRAVVEFMARLLPLAEFTLTRPHEPASLKRWPEAQVPPDWYG